MIKKKFVWKIIKKKNRKYIIITFYFWYEIEIKTLINNKFMLIKKCSKIINLCINLVFIVFLIRN